MKMVIVFDTEDRQGMANTIKMVDQLAAEYMGHRLREPPPPPSPPPAPPPHAALL